MRVFFFLLRLSCFLVLYLLLGWWWFGADFNIVRNLPAGLLSAAVLALIVRRESLFGGK